MGMDIQTQSIQSSTFMFVESHCAPSEIAAALGSSLPRVYGHAMQSGIELAGPPTVIYTKWEADGAATLRAGMPVAAGAQGSEGIQVEELPATQAAVTVHVGSYEGLGEVHKQMQAWIQGQGYTPAGPPREVYLNDPAEVKDPARFETQVIWPVRQA